jgi:hypothetical protein
MSALWADDDDSDLHSRTRPDRNRPGNQTPSATPKHSGPRPGSRRRLARIPFVGVLILVFGIGMAGLLTLNTTLQDQSFQSRKLDDRADKLTHRQAVLKHKTRQLRAPDRLAEHAWQLGLRPNDQHTVLNLSNGNITGKPRPAGKGAMPGIKPSAAESTQQQGSDGKTVDHRPGHNSRTPGEESYR